MSQKSQKVFSRHSQPKEPTQQQLKFEIFANLPLAVFRDFTNVRSLIVHKYEQQQKDKPATTFYINRKVEEYYRNLSKTDEWNDSLKDLEFIGSKADENAKIWLLSKREQNRIYAHSTKQQKKFLYLPKNVLRHATNFEQLVHAAAAERGAAQPGNFVDDIFNTLPRIDNWIPALSNLKYDQKENAQPRDESDIGPEPKSNVNASGTPRGQQKRKSHKISIDDDAISDEESPLKLQKRRKSIRLQSKERVSDENDEHHVPIVKSSKESKIPLIDKRRKSRASELVFYGPNEFQRKVQQLNVEDFVVMTNIKEIILDEYRNEVRDINAEMSEDELTNRLLVYNSMRMDIRKWNCTGLDKLKFIDDIPKQKSTAQQQNTAKATSSTSTFNSSDKKSNQMNTNDKTNHSKTSVEPNDFQKEIFAMSYETFIDETNVKELVRKKFESETEPLSDAALEDELKKLDEERYHFRRYHKSLLNHLKFLKCECRRNKTFHDKSTQTDMVQVQNADAQCVSVERATPVQGDQLHNSCQSKLTMLSVHEITESEIIQIESISSTVVADIVTTTEPQTTYPANDSLLPNVDGTEFYSSGSGNEMSRGIEPTIEDLVATLEMDCDGDIEDHNVEKLADIQFTQAITDDPIQPDSSADGMVMVQKLSSQDESEIIHQSEVVECEIISENISVTGQYGAEKNLTAVDLLVNEASLTDPEVTNKSNTDEYQLSSTQPAGIPDEKESIANVKTPCHQMKPFVEAEKSNELNESSNVQEQNLATSFENVNSSFEPNEISTPKSTNEVKSEEKLCQTPCQTVQKDEKKRKSAEAVLHCAQNPLENASLVKKFFDGLRNKDPQAIGRLREVILGRPTQ